MTDSLSSSTIKLGLMSPLTGIVAMYGLEIYRAAQIACMEVNESGGVLGKPLELIIEDDGSLPESAIAAANKLVTYHHCAAIIGNLLSNSRIAVAFRVAEPRQIPMLNFSFYEGSILSHYFFHFAALPNQQIEKMIPFMRKKFGPKMFFAGNNYEWPRGSIDAAKIALKKCEGLVVGEEYCSIGVTDEELDYIFKKLGESGADVFVPYFAGSDQIRLLTQFVSRGFKEKIAVVMGHYDELMASLLPPEVRAGFYSSNTYFMTLDTLENTGFLKRLNEQAGVDGIWPHGNGILTNFGEGAYLCVKAFAEAANRAGSTASEELIKHLETVSVRSPQGLVTMDLKTHHAKVNTFLSCCERDGSFTVIEKFGSIDPILPERYKYLAVSSRTSSEDDIRLQAKIVEQMTEGILLLTAHDRKIVYINPGAERMFGYSKAELLNESIFILQPPETDASEVIAASVEEILHKKGAWRGEVKVQKKDASVIWCAVSITAFTHALFGEAWIAVYKDITMRKMRDEQLRTAKDEAERANNSKSLFLASMSHEIRTPMNAIVGMADLLMGTRVSDEQKKYIQTLQAASEALLSLVSDVLDISKIEQETFDLASESFDFCELIQGCIEIYSAKAREKNLELFYELDEAINCQLIGDSSRIRQVILNLLGNAVKFTEKGFVVLKIKAGKKVDEMLPLQIDVYDTGIGIPLDKQKSIFKPFTQADVNTAKKYGGTGLGLAISSRLIKKMGGEISLRSREGRYSLFRVKLRLKIISDLTLKDLLNSQFKILQGRRALILANTKVAAHFLQRTLQMVGVECFCLFNSEDVVLFLTEEQARGHTVDFLINCGFETQFCCDLIEKVRSACKDHAFHTMMISSKYQCPEWADIGCAGLTCMLGVRDLYSSLVQSLSSETMNHQKPPELGRIDKAVLMRGRILIVDDSDDNRLLIEAFLKNTGLSLDFADNGQEALEKWRTQKYDAILIDMQMPVMDGYSAMREIRKIEAELKEKFVPIIAVTAFAMKEDRDKCIAAGASDYLAKPLKKTVLIDLLGKYLTGDLGISRSH